MLLFKVTKELKKALGFVLFAFGWIFGAIAADSPS
jgi:hypothetical protein